MFAYPKQNTFKKGFFTNQLIVKYETLCLEHSIDTSKTQEISKIKTRKWLEARIISLAEYNILNEKLTTNFSRKVRGNYLELITLLK